MNEFTVRLDLAKGKARQQQTVFVRQGDKNATTIVATITDHGAAAATSGLTARFQMRLPDGTHYYRKAASLSGNTATVTLDETQAASAVGRTDTAYFQLLQGSTVVASTESFTVVVLPDALADATVPESYDSAIQDAIDALDAAVADMPDMVEDVLEAHPEWTTTVQDGSITKDKLATDLARDRERLLYRLDNMLTAQLPEVETATATDAAKTPLAGLALYGRSTQDGTPTPSAPVPIVSVAPDSQGNISLWARGFNQWDEQWESGDIDATTGQNTGNATTWRSTNYVAVLPSTEYFIEGTAVSGSQGYVRARFYDADKGYIGSVDADGRPLAIGLTFVTPANCRYMRFAPQLTNVTDKQVCINLSGPRNGEYQPYTSTVTPVPLDGHELRSLPDGTRDEVTVGADGHAVLVQRVGVLTLDGSETWTAENGGARVAASLSPTGIGPTSSAQVANLLCDHFVASSLNDTWVGASAGMDISTNGQGIHVSDGTRAMTANGFKTWLASNPMTLDYPLATPVTHDLGTIDPVPLCGPDLTAQAVPTAPFALTYERDLDATLARLESAIADVATS